MTSDAIKHLEKCYAVTGRLAGYHREMLADYTGRQELMWSVSELIAKAYEQIEIDRITERFLK